MYSILTPARPQFFAVQTLAVAIAVAVCGSQSARGALAEENRPIPQASSTLQIRPLPPQPAKEVFIRNKPHVNVGTQGAATSKLKARPARPKGPGSFSAQPNVLADWYCGEGSGPGGHAVCTDALIASCSGTYKPPGTNGPEQTWGMCHEKS